MEQVVVVNPAVRGMYFSDYLGTFEPEQDGSYFHYPSLDVDKFLATVRDWTESNYDNLPDLFLQKERETESMCMKVRLPYTDNLLCTRNPNHKRKERRIDSSGRVICNHHKIIPVDLGIDGFSFTLGWDRLAAKVKPDYHFTETPGPFHQDFSRHQESLKDKKPVLVVDCCDAIISDVNSLLPLEYIVRKENSARNCILAIYGQPPADGFTEIFEPNPSKPIPQELRGKNLTAKRELLAFSYDSNHTAYLVKLWWMQGTLGSASLLREVNAHGALEDYN